MWRRMADPNGLGEREVIRHVEECYGIPLTYQQETGRLNLLSPTRVASAANKSKMATSSSLQLPSPTFTYFID